MKSHIKRLVAPKSWILLRKEQKFVVRPRPGAHPVNLCTPIVLLLKKLGYASTTQEIKKILNTKELLVDGKRVKEYKFPVGFMDIITIKDTGDIFRVLLDGKGRLKAVPIDKEESALKICRIKKKTLLKGKKLQLNLSDNRNILVDNNEYTVGDSVLITVPFQEIKQRIPFEKGAAICLIGGKHSGHIGVVTDIEGNNFSYISANKNYKSLKKYAFVVGKGKELIKLG